MNMKILTIKNFTGILAIVISFNISCNAQMSIVSGTEITVKSPDGNIAFNFYQKADENNKRTMYYKVTYKGEPVILESALDIRLDNHLFEQALALKVPRHERWCENLKVVNIVSERTDTSWTTVDGERAQVKDNYNQTTIETEKDDYPKYKLNLEIRAYNEGVAFRYYFPENPTGVYYHITSENDEFVLPEGTKAWFTSWAQGPYQLLPLANWPDESERPLTLAINNGLYVSLLEADLTNYPRTKFRLSDSKPNTIVTSLYSSADLITFFSTPWRGIMIADAPGKLIENNFFIENLCEPSKISKTDWIKPGKIIREMSLTTEGALQCIDFAAEHNLQYILFDWKWYGPAMTFLSDAREVKANIDMKKVVDYGKQKNVGVWLYVNQQALVKQDYQLYPLYHQWGIKGVKYGFVEVGSQMWTNWLTSSIEKAAENQIMVNIHDEYRPTGTSRTWPNVLTQEGIRGNEEMPDATHNTILPFTRMIVGAADYTVCYYTDRIKTTHAHQLALPVIFYSPLQTLFWYDKPSDYKGEPEIEFFERVPTTWDDTKVLQGIPGEYISIARRSGNDWFVGFITNNEGREMNIKFDFLPKGIQYTASIYSDDPSLKTRTHVKIERVKLDPSKTIRFKLQPSGGVAIWLHPDVKRE